MWCTCAGVACRFHKVGPHQPLALSLALPTQAAGWPLLWFLLGCAFLLSIMFIMMFSSMLCLHLTTHVPLIPTLHSPLTIQITCYILIIYLGSNKYLMLIMCGLIVTLVLYGCESFSASKVHFILLRAYIRHGGTRR